MSEPLIVGIDPGSTSAVAGLNLEKQLVLLESQKEFSREDMIMEIVQEGVPVLVGCDTREMPSTAQKIASNFGAHRFSPKEDLKKSRKQELGSKGENSHEKDAIAAAIHAFNNYQRRIRKIRNDADRKEEKKEIAKRRFGKDIDASGI